MSPDFAVTFWINGFAGHTLAVDRIGIIAATALLFMIGVAVIFVIAQRTLSTRALFVTEVLGTLIIAYSISQFIGVVAFRERPFVRHPVRQLIAKDGGEKSFPSDHATLAFALVFPAVAVVRRRWAKVLFIASAVVVGVARVFVGVHYVSDVIAGGLLAFIVWWFVHRGVRRWWQTKSTTRA